MDFIKNDETKKTLIQTGILFLVFIIYTLLVTKVNVAELPVTLTDGTLADPSSAEVGFSKINNAIHLAINYNGTWYLISKCLGILAFVVAAFFAFLGCAQLFTSKSIAKVDKDLFVLAGFYVLVLATYILFEKVTLNYRPFILDIEEGLEGSYPSSHAMLGMCVFITAAMQFKNRLKNKNVNLTVRIICVALAILTVVSRLLSGVHWFTDIIGGVLVSAFLISLYKTVFLIIINRNKESFD